MLIDRELYKEHYELKYYPEWKCPECKAGNLIAQDNKVKTFEYPSSKKLMNGPEWEPYWITGNFIGLLICSNSKCNCTVVFSGNMFVEGVVVEEIDEPPYHIQGYGEHITPKYFNPPLEIIPVHQYLPENVASCLKESFELFWSDNSACANKIRIMVETIMTEKGIPKSYIDKKKHKRFRYTLHKRIEFFQLKNKEVGELLLATKWIGNEGSHDINKLKREDVLIAYEIIQQCTEKLYNTRPTELLFIAKKINRDKGIKNNKRKVIRK